MEPRWASRKKPPFAVHWICLSLLPFNPSREEPSASIKQVQGDLCSAGKPCYPFLQVLHAASADAQGCTSPANSIKGASKVSDVTPWEISTSSGKTSGNRITDSSEWGSRKEQRREQAVHMEVLAGEHRVTLGKNGIRELRC